MKQINNNTICWKALFACLIALNCGFAQQNFIKSDVYKLAEANKEKKETGFRRTLLVGQTLDFKSFRVHYTTVNAHQKSHAPHKHITEELIIVKEGEITLTVEGVENRLTVGDVAIIKPNDMHGIENPSHKKATYMVMIYEANYIKPNTISDSTFVIHWNDLEFKKHDLGGRRNVFDKGTAQTKRFEMHITTLNAGNQSHAPHTHRAAEILIPIKGKTEEFIDGQWISSKTGDIIFLESKVPHALRNIGKTSCTYFAFQFE